MAVVFRAGEEVILDNGFDSGNSFIAEISPCFATVEEIAAKTNYSETENKTKFKQLFRIALFGEFVLMLVGFFKLLY